MATDQRVLKDSGHRREFESGAVRDMPDEKGRYDLIPATALHRLALVYERGAKKYEENNWMKGIPLNSYLDSAMRHINQLKLGYEDEDHAAQAAWNMMAFIWTLEAIERGKLPQELDNRQFKFNDLFPPKGFTLPTAPARPGRRPKMGVVFTPRPIVPQPAKPAQSKRYPILRVENVKQNTAKLSRMADRVLKQMGRTKIQKDRLTKATRKAK